VCDEAVRRRLMTTTDHCGSPTPKWHLVELDRAQAMELLGNVDYGRMVFTQGALRRFGR
jgi:hypothetical protein